MIYIPADLVLLLSAFGVQHWSFTKAKCQFLCTKWALRKWMLNFLFDNPSSVLAFLRRRPALLLFTHMHGMYTQWISQALFFFITYGNEHFIKKMIFIIHYSVHFLATPPSKISTGTKKQNAAYNDETYAVWRMETVFDLPSKKICSASRKWMASIVSRKTSGNSPQKRCNFKGHLSILIYLHSCEIPITMA